MENYEPKKLLILRILEILRNFSDSDHKLRQGDIISLLRVHYGMECERKAVARNALLDSAIRKICKSAFTAVAR